MQAQKLHRVDLSLIEEARAAFRPTPPTPDSTSIEKVMYEAGAIKVLDWLERKLTDKGSTTVGTTEYVNLADSEEGFLRRISNVV